MITVYEYAVRSVNGHSRNFEHLECERLKPKHIGNRRKHYEFSNLAIVGFGIKRNLLSFSSIARHLFHPFMLLPFALAFLPECHTRNWNGYRLILNMKFVIYQLRCSSAQKHQDCRAHKFCDETNGTWNMVNQRQVWHNSHLALMYWREEKKETFFYQKHFCFKRRSSFVHPCILFLSSSDQRPNWWIHIVHTKKERQKKIFKSRFPHIFFLLLCLVKDNKQKNKK